MTCIVWTQGELVVIPFEEDGPDALRFWDALAFCRALGGNLSAPSSLQDEAMGRWWKGFLDSASVDANGSSSDMKRFWLPFTDRGKVREREIKKKRDPALKSFPIFK